MTMGREIRMVPPNWQHPETEDAYGRTRLQPMFDSNYASAKAEWLSELAKWEAGERPSHFDASEYPSDYSYWEWESNPPSRAYYRPWADDDATWFQLWETVSEGTPVSPPFATRQELADYLAENGDFWDQKRCLEPGWERLFGGVPGKSGWGKQRAEAFVNVGWAPSMIMMGGKLLDGKLAAGI
jgi:hypothetical protein